MKIQRRTQYNVVELEKDVSILLNGEETASLERYQKKFKKTREEPTFKEVEPKEGNPLCLAYGYLIPQIGMELEDWTAELENYKEFAHGTVMGKSMYLSCYNDFVLYPEHKAETMGAIPCAMLLNTSLNFEKVRNFGLGYTMYLLRNGMGSITNMLNRHYLFCLCGVEKDFNPEACENWKDCISQEKIQTMAENWR